MNNINGKETKILHIPINRIWFDMIFRGIKTEEYREIKKHWISRLINKPYSQMDKTLKQIENTISCRMTDYFKEFDVIRFHNGYQSDAAEMYVGFEGIEISTGVPEWGASIGEFYFCIQLGKVISYKNIKDA